MSDYIVRATAGNGSIRAFAATTRDLVQHAREIHHTSPVASAALGRMLTAAAMMGSMLKGDKDILTLQVRGEGPLQGIVVTSDSKAQVKGYVFNPSVEIPDLIPGKLNVSGAIGAGHLSVIKDIGMREPYAGKIELVTGEIAEDLTYYFAQSEQTPSAIGLGVLVETDTSIRRAGGFIIQLLPDATDEMIDKLEKKLATIPYVSDLLDMGQTPEGILEMILGDFDLKIMDTIPTAFYCNCTRERVEKALISIGKEELEKIIREDKKANLHCHFCSKEYDFNEEQLVALLEEAK
ncbi:MAG: Hsp33 family molecular chaperone HslO [Anaerotignum sp.]|nr:Hsp33 family molecular chaperone HslO [Anaerotignum sp.]